MSQTLYFELYQGEDHISTVEIAPLSEFESPTLTWRYSITDTAPDRLYRGTLTSLAQSGTEPLELVAAALSDYSERRHRRMHYQGATPYDEDLPHQPVSSSGPLQWN